MKQHLRAFCIVALLVGSLPSLFAQGSQPSVARCTQPNALHNARSVPHRLKHHPPADHQLHGLAELTRGGRRKRRLCPRKELAPEARAQELRDDPDLVLRDAQHLGDHVAMVDDALCRFVQSKRHAVPDGD